MPKLWYVLEEISPDWPKYVLGATSEGTEHLGEGVSIPDDVIVEFFYAKNRFEESQYALDEYFKLSQAQRDAYSAQRRAVVTPQVEVTASDRAESLGLEVESKQVHEVTRERDTPITHKLRRLTAMNAQLADKIAQKNETRLRKELKQEHTALLKALRSKKHSPGKTKSQKTLKNIEKTGL